MKPIFIKIENSRLNLNDVVGYSYRFFDDPRHHKGVLIVELRNKREPINILGDETLLTKMDEAIEEVLKC